VEFLAKVLKVFRADLQLQHLFDHWRKVGERADRAERCRAGRAYHSPRRCQNEGDLDCFQRYATFVQLSSKHSVLTTPHARSARVVLSIEKPAHVFALIERLAIHEFSLAGRAAKIGRVLCTAGALAAAGVIAARGAESGITEGPLVIIIPSVAAAGMAGVGVGAVDKRVTDIRVVPGD
jgi:hypothetical protein